MKTYYYVHTGHRIGLDRFRRATTILRALKDEDITLLCSDFRIAQIARDFGIDDCVGVDVVRNIPYIAHHGDRLIFDSDEANPIMLEDMKNFFSTFIHIKTDEVVVDEKYFEKKEKTISLAFFFGDDDYEKDMQEFIPLLQELDACVLLGFYYFLDYEDFIKENINNTYEFEDYDEVITKSEVLITASPQATLECLASGGKPIFIQRDDYPTEFNEIFEKLNIPIVYISDKKLLKEQISIINANNYNNIDINSNKIVEIIKESLTL